MGSFISAFSNNRGSSATPNYLNILLMQQAYNTKTPITTIDNSVLTVCDLPPTNYIAAQSPGYLLYGYRGITSIDLKLASTTTYPWHTNVSLGSYDFANMPDLESITLTDFKGRQLPSDLIDQNPKLTFASIKTWGQYSTDDAVISSIFGTNPALQTVSFDTRMLSTTNVFISAPALKSLYISNRITSIDSNALINLSSVPFTIYIDRAPDAISGAPWGAANATVQWTGTT